MSNQRAMRRRLAGVKGVSHRKRTKSARQLQRSLGKLSEAAGRMSEAVERMQEAAQAQLAENANKPPTGEDPTEGEDAESTVAARTVPGSPSPSGR